MRAETQATVESIRKSLGLLAQRMDWETAPHRLEEMNAMIEDGDLWSDPSRAQKLMRDRQVLSDKVETFRRIDRDLKDSVELIELGEAEGDAEIVADAESTLKTLAELAAQEGEGGGVYGVVFRGRRYDTGDKLSYLKANVTIASEREDLGPELRAWLIEFAKGLEGKDADQA